ncbi:MAG: FAD-dependent oxidoreductase [Kofleriaceae bacterium]
MSPAARAPDRAVDFLIIGAGITGLGFANGIRAEAAARGAPPPSVLILEAAAEPGGYCRTVVQDGFVWDYSGHFFHFADPSIEAWLRERMPDQDVRTVARRAKVRFAGRDIDAPFQAHIHQLPQADFIECLVDLYEASQAPPGPPPRTFKELALQTLGRGIAERFVLPYNSKLYTCELEQLDAEAMGRFFPRVDLDAAIASMRPGARRADYNSTFTYPAGGAVEYVRALLRDLPPELLALGERATSIDRARKVVTTSRREVGYRHLISTIPLPSLAKACGLPAPAATFSANKVVVYNLGFDRKGAEDVHWMYFPDPARVFYRVGWYDNILDTPRMSLYVEIAAHRDANIDRERTLERVLADLRAERIVDKHQLVSWHHVELDPAYVHLTAAARAAAAALRGELERAEVHSIGRYGAWTYCSIEDNLLEARALAARLASSVLPE